MARCVVMFVASSCLSCGPNARTDGSRLLTPSADDNLVLQWNNTVLLAVRNSRAGPPVVSRALAVVHTCMYEAWAAYDATAVGTETGDSLRRPRTERTITAINEAISFAAYRAAADVFPSAVSSIYYPMMRRLGYDVQDRSIDVTTPRGIGNVACAAVLASRHTDGANQEGDMPNGTLGVRFSDYTGYRPVNAPLDVSGPLDPSTVKDPGRWQPLTFRDRQGQLTTQAFATPQWPRVTPFTTDLATRLLTEPPYQRQPGSPRARAEVDEVVRLSSHLTDKQKAVVEYWADGPDSETPPGHWNLFAQYISRRDHHGAAPAGIGKDVRLFFALNNALLDAGIASWDAKIRFDSVRPITAVRSRFGTSTNRAWGGAGKGTIDIPGNRWLPYQRAISPTPAFAEYPSGHSTFSAAAAEVLRRFTGSDRFGLRVRRAAGSSRIEPGVVPRDDVELGWATFSDAADEAGFSRRLGGIHFKQGDLDGRHLGRVCGAAVWARAGVLFSGG